MNPLSEKILSIYEAADNTLATESKACSNGCWHCCRQLILVHAAEEIPITAYIQRTFGPDLRRRVHYNLHRWFQTLEANTPDKDVLTGGTTNKRAMRDQTEELLSQDQAVAVAWSCKPRAWMTLMKVSSSGFPSPDRAR